MTKDHVTLKDIARIAGVSTATASLALSGDSRVNVKTRRAVEEVAKRLKYVPNEIGRSLRAKKAETIALIFPNTTHFAFSHPYFVQLLEGITEVLVENSFHLLLSTAPSEADEAAAYDKILRNRRADGIILWPASIRDRNIQRIVESGYPVVYLGKWHHDEVVTVEREEFGGAYKATEHLIKQGRRKLVMISGPLDYQVSIERVEGFKRALQDHQILFEPWMVVEKDFSMEAGVEAANELLESGHRFDGIFAANDRMAIGAMKGLQQAGITIPGDVAVVGCDNIEMAAMTSPTLTTIDQPMREIGAIAARKLIALLNREDIGEKQTVVPSQLIIRESCGAEA
ncbi:LacI family DNA-binding transcriptional regulator [Cohnella thailandensis]|uniref:LacI family DNA-binding transcriptional regulator n=1 Tax=Cohnella thailandensis TaxID=557557 RepID=A0A841T4Q9_9BACL|nr:LacI family DNA-binding transcriptional regulator [Cohnella thailandensis]MBB6637635.1 LacI family DNA-binding transcriptional regulator [Cohnella thailandensis]MBP1974189.1 DNA-binding LacI/PurR family transcriptional regulator [Cohnella thailandensis]